MALRTTTSKTTVDSVYTEEKRAPEKTFIETFDKVHTGTSGHDDQKGRSGNDLFISSPGGDSYNGAAGTDWVTYQDSSEGVTVDLKNGTGDRGDAKGDTFESIENVTGSDHDDIITGSAERNILKGGDGDDLFIVSEGRDYIDGGKGFDTLDYSQMGEGVEVDLRDQTDDISGQEFTGIEGVIGTSDADTVHATSKHTVFDGGQGADTLKLYHDTGSFEFNGGGGNDTIDASLAHGWWNAQFDFQNGTVTVSETGEIVGRFTGVEIVFGTDGNNVFIDGGNLKTVYGNEGSDIFHTTDGGFVKFDGGTNGTDTISFAEATTGLGSGGFGAVEEVEEIIGTDFDDDFTVLPMFVDYHGGNGNDTFLFSEDHVDLARAQQGDNTLSHMQYDGGDGIDTLIVDGNGGTGVFALTDDFLGYDGWITALFHNAAISNVENFEFNQFNGTFIGDDADNAITLHGNDINGGAGTFESDMQINGGGGDDSVSVIFGAAINGHSSALDFDGGAGFDTLSYAESYGTLFIDDTQYLGAEHIRGLTINVAEGNVQERRMVEDDGTLASLQDSATTHTFENVESFRGSQLADLFIDGEGSQTYEGVNHQGDAPAETYSDLFVFSSNESNFGDVDTIVDFNAGEDRIDLSATGTNAWQDLLDSMEQVGDDTVLDLGFGHELVLQYVDMNTLTQDDFIF